MPGEDESEDALPSPDSLEQLKCYQLAEICRLLEIARGGRKSQTVTKIRDTLADLSQQDTQEASEKLGEAMEMIHDLFHKEGICESEGRQMEYGSLQCQQNDISHSAINNDVPPANTDRGVEKLESILSALTVMLGKQTQCIQALKDEQKVIAPELPEFSGTEDCRYTTSEWLLVVEQFAKEFNWSQFQKLRYASAKLSGAARIWHEKCGNSFLNFDCWKQSLISSLGERRFTWEEKRLLLDKKQLPNVPFDVYALQKWGYATRFGLTLKDATEFILRGMHDKRAAQVLSARSYSCIGELLEVVRDVSKYSVAEGFVKNGQNQ